MSDERKKAVYEKDRLMEFDHNELEKDLRDQGFDFSKPISARMDSKRAFVVYEQPPKPMRMGRF